MLNHLMPVSYPGIQSSERVGFPRVEKREDVRMLEICGNLDLLDEPLGAEDRGEFWAQHFHRHLAVVFEVFGKGQLPIRSVKSLSSFNASGVSWSVIRSTRSPSR